MTNRDRRSTHKPKETQGCPAGYGSWAAGSQLEEVRADQHVRVDWRLIRKLEEMGN